MYLLLQIDKTIQMYETMLVRHTTMVRLQLKPTATTADCKTLHERCNTNTTIH
jgi:hypothetical protein